VPFILISRLRIHAKGNPQLLSNKVVTATNDERRAIMPKQNNNGSGRKEYSERPPARAPRVPDGRENNSAERPAYQAPKPPKKG
jgi:hypothetical protein